MEWGAGADSEARSLRPRNSRTRLNRTNDKAIQSLRYGTMELLSISVDLLVFQFHGSRKEDVVLEMHVHVKVGFEFAQFAV